MQYSDYDDLTTYEATSTNKKGRTSSKQARKAIKAARNKRQNRRDASLWGQAMRDLIEFLTCSVILVSGILVVSLVWLALEAVLIGISRPFITLYKTIKGTQNDVNI